MGVDVIAVTADIDLSILSAVCQIRTGDYLHIVLANRKGKEGIYAGGFQAMPGYKEDEGVVIFTLDTGHVRNKKELRRFDGWNVLFQEEGKR